MTGARGDAEVLGRALAETARVPESLKEPITERVLKRCLRTSLESAGLRPVPSEFSIRLVGWPGVGGVDVAIGPADELPTVVELKWGSGTLYNCAWDALKLALALREAVVARAFIVAGAPVDDWSGPTLGSELFATRGWDTEAFLSDHAASFAKWRRDVKTRPVRVPDAFETGYLTTVRLTVEGAPCEIRCGEVRASACGGWTQLDEEGRVTAGIVEVEETVGVLPTPQLLTDTASSSGQPRVTVVLPCPYGHLSEYTVRAPVRSCAVRCAAREGR